jgi:hypothetical protein
MVRIADSYDARPVSLYFLIPLLVLLIAVLLLGTVVVLGRWRGGRYLRAIVTRIPFLQRIFSRMSIAALERSNPELASAMKKMQAFGPPASPEQAQRAMNLLTPAERKAYLAAAGDTTEAPETTNRQQRRRLERSALPGGGRAPGSRGKGKSKKKR